jgi:hypothetical protein
MSNYERKAKEIIEKHREAFSSLDGIEAVIRIANHIVNTETGQCFLLIVSEDYCLPQECIWIIYDVDDNGKEVLSSSIKHARNVSTIIKRIKEGDEKYAVEKYDFSNCL